MKRTLICTHVMPYEIEMFSHCMAQYKKAFSYLDENDDVTYIATLNLNPELTDWESSELNQEYFIEKFNQLFDGIPNINQIVTDTSLKGTTQQKRECIRLDFDQFIFCDTDILFHEMLLKYQLNMSYMVDGMYIISPSLPKWWDASWDVLTHSKYMDKPYGYALEDAHTMSNAWNQEVEEIVAKELPVVKFGCGMHTLYSKEFWNFVGIPDSLGGYGPEDTFGMIAANAARQLGYPIRQFVLDGIYITEDYLNRTPSFNGKIKSINKKDEFRAIAERNMPEEIQSFVRRIGG